LNSSSDDDAANVARYEELVARHGYDFRALNWGSVQSQEERFTILAGIAPLAGTRVLDVGCGLGDFRLWLLRNGTAVDYHGIDIAPSMVEFAKNRQPDAAFSVSTLSDELKAGHRYDYVFASGIFCFRKNEPFDYMQRTVQAMFHLCERGVAFNSLSLWRDRPAEDEFYADPVEVISFCRNLSRRIVLRHDYHPADFTVYLYKAVAP
jgi:SAM-dependent methyltransferase